MSEVFLEQMLNKNIYQIFDEGPLEPFFFTQREMESCDFMQGADKVWFGAPLDARCLKLVQDKPDQPIDVYVQRANDTMWTKIGRFEGVAPNMFDIRHRPAVHVQLTPDQRVFTEAQAGYRSFMIGGVFFDAGLEATYMPISPPVPRGAYLRATSSSLHVIGTVAGKSKAVFNFNSWIATKLYVSDNPR